ncbi:cardiolipin-specific phospholipase [Cryptococcus wingfieldii CBS 7118]|uniref:Cardiolipin-specific phospholipase n=1 Tax=Cryptococcus wingfieldii CBS 7118 TaxID=1295528 RepID=A0A1E3JL10_9TREE|nr:cardiolipin-specific phospholipase [Cryptococcus wingfieldii CBS 7118]ODO00612.1 cardiolipin-specific phospholipase [Cryptococcus wingfieldii CBS 7118]
MSSTPLPQSRDIPKDFRASLSAWWSSGSYKNSRLAEERLLRRLTMYEPKVEEAKVEGSKGWLGWGHGASSVTESQSATAQVASTVTLESSGSGSPAGLVASLRNVFIPTPDPEDAPLHPADPRTPLASLASSPASSSTSVDSHEKKHKHKCHKHRKDGELVDYINTLEISAPKDKNSKEAVVVLHGYAAALGFFFRNWESIATAASSTDRRAFFLDWLGMGLSSRPSPALLASPSTASTSSRVARAEHFFLSSLESWREEAGVDKMVLVGHSLGGYLASAYAVRYPERVSGLILVSPAGIPHGPEYVRQPLTAEVRSAASSRERVETPGDLDGAVNAAEMELGDQTKDSAPKGEAKAARERNEQSFSRRNMMKLFVWGWERGLSPFSILRGLGPWGPLWVGKYSSRRFAAQTEEDVRDLHNYIYETSVMKGSGEFCISHILAPGAYARIPILDRIARISAPVTFMFGDNDWMDVQGGYDSKKLLAEAGNEKCEVHVVPKAGHHLYLDNPEVSNRILREAIESAPRQY